mgnify:CR=1 FL=1
MKKDKKYLIIYILITLGVLIGFSCSNYLFGSNTDWLNQHTAFPEYFRKSFYTTHNFFPNFVFNLVVAKIYITFLIMDFIIL